MQDQMYKRHRCHYKCTCTCSDHADKILNIFYTDISMDDTYVRISATIAI